MSEVLSPRSFSQGAVTWRLYQAKGKHTMICLSVCLSVCHFADVTSHANIRQNSYCGKLSSQQDSPLWWMWHLTNLFLYLSGTASTREVCPTTRRANHDSHFAVCLHDLRTHQQHFGKTDLQCVSLQPTMCNSILCLLNGDMGVWPGLYCTDQISITMWIEQHQ